MIAVGLLDVAVPDAVVAKAAKTLDAFSRYWLIGISGMIVSKDGPIDPLQSWIHENFGTAPSRKRSQAQDVPEPKRRVIRLKGSD